MRRALTLSHSLSVKRLKSLNSLVAVTDFLSSDLFILATKKTAKAVFFCLGIRCRRNRTMRMYILMQYYFPLQKRFSDRDDALI